MSEINCTQIDIVKDIDIVMPVYNLIEYSDNYLVGDNDSSVSFKFKQKITGQTGAKLSSKKK